MPASAAVMLLDQSGDSTWSLSCPTGAEMWRLGLASASQARSTVSLTVSPPETIDIVIGHCMAGFVGGA